MKNIPKIVLFDLDGTIFDNQELIITIYEKIMRDLHYIPPERSVIAQLMGRATHDTGLELGISEVHLPQVDAAFWKYFRDFCDSVTKESVNKMLMPYMRDIIHLLKTNNVIIGLVTSNEHLSAEKLLELSDLRACFSSIIGREDTMYLKPSPKPLLAIINQISKEKYSKNDIWFIGDSVTDVLAANAANITSIFIGDNEVPTFSDFIFRSSENLFTEIKAIMGQTN